MISSRTLKIGFSPCPNDTFQFFALAHGRVKVAGFRFEPVLEDIEQLNLRALDPEQRLPITKLSLPAFAQLQGEYEALDAGAALGRGVGPLVVRSAARFELQGLADLEGMTVATPGRLTTAHLLLSMFGPADMHFVPMRFDWIMPAVQQGNVDAGLVIHEGRFTHARHDLVPIADLGSLWEMSTHLPLPLAVIAAQRGLGAHVLHSLSDAVAQSVAFAMAEPAATKAYVRAHAQELSAKVCGEHIKLYVNEFSKDMGEEGRRALTTMLARAAQHHDAE